MPHPNLNDDDFAAFWRDGYVLTPDYFDAEEMTLLQRAIALDDSIRAHAVRIDDSAGGAGTVEPPGRRSLRRLRALRAHRRRC
jgi:hypothetical protein